MERSLMAERGDGDGVVAVVVQRNQALDKISDNTDRDYFLSPAEAVEYGLIDRVVDSSGDGGIITEG